MFPTTLLCMNGAARYDALFNVPEAEDRCHEAGEGEEVDPALVCGLNNNK